MVVVEEALQKVVVVVAERALQKVVEVAVAAAVAQASARISSFTQL